MISNLTKLRRLRDFLMRCKLPLYLTSGVADAVLIMNPGRKSINDFRRFLYRNLSNLMGGMK
jgi:hypothetical protein